MFGADLIWYIFFCVHLCAPCNTNLVLLPLSLAEGCAKPSLPIGVDPIPILLFCMSRLKPVKVEILTADRVRPLFAHGMPMNKYIMLLSPICIVLLPIFVYICQFYMYAYIYICMYVYVCICMHISWWVNPYIFTGQPNFGDDFHLCPGPLWASSSQVAGVAWRCEVWVRCVQLWWGCKQTNNIYIYLFI